jgi:hypothetical protein
MTLAPDEDDQTVEPNSVWLKVHPKLRGDEHRAKNAKTSGARSLVSW